MKVRILHNSDGTVSVFHPASKSRREDETEEQWVERVFTKATPDGVEYKDIDLDDEPLCDRDFRGAWIKGASGKALDIHIGKAREITKARLRVERKPLLEAQDVLYMKALEKGEDTSAIVAEKQRLRDITKIDHVDDLETMKSLKAEGKL